MGNLCSCNNVGPLFIDIPPNSEEAHQDQEVNPLDGETVQFRVSLKNFKLRNVKRNKNFFLKIRFGEIKYGAKFFKSEDTLHKSKTWQDEFVFDFKVRMGDLRKQYLYIEVFLSKSNCMYASTSVDLWSVATGPVHHDRVLYLAADTVRDNEKIDRISFDVSMEEIKHWSMQFRNLDCYLNPEHVSDEDAQHLLRYIFDRSVVKGEDESAVTYTSLPAQECGIQDETSDVSSDSDASLASGGSSIVAHRKLSWPKSRLPAIRVHGGMKDVVPHTIRLQVRKVRYRSTPFETYEYLLCECWLSVEKLFAGATKEDPKTPKLNADSSTDSINSRHSGSLPPESPKKRPERRKFSFGSVPKMYFEAVPSPYGRNSVRHSNSISHLPINHPTLNKSRSTSAFRGQLRVDRSSKLLPAAVDPLRRRVFSSNTPTLVRKTSEESAEGGSVKQKISEENRTMRKSRSLDSFNFASFKNSIPELSTGTDDMSDSESSEDDEWGFHIDTTNLESPGMITPNGTPTTQTSTNPLIMIEKVKRSNNNNSSNNNSNSSSSISSANSTSSSQSNGSIDNSETIANSINNNNNNSSKINNNNRNKNNNRNNKKGSSENMVKSSSSSSSLNRRHRSHSPPKQLSLEKMDSYESTNSINSDKSIPTIPSPRKRKTVTFPSPLSSPRKDITNTRKRRAISVDEVMLESKSKEAEHNQVFTNEDNNNKAVDIVIDDSKDMMVSAIRERLWIRGINVGYITGTIVFHNTPTISQMISGVSTENGVVSNSPVVIGALSKKRSIFSIFKSPQPSGPSEVNKLNILLADLQSQPVWSPKTKKAEALSLQLVDQIIGLIRVSHRTGMASYVYPHKNSLAEGRAIFLEIWSYCLNTLEAAPYKFRCKLFEVIQDVMLRSELSDLTLLGFNPHEANKDDFEPDYEDIQFGNKYRKVLDDTLKYTLKKMSYHGSYEELRIFCAKVLAVLYFRIPELQDMILEAILPEKEDSVVAWSRHLLIADPQVRVENHRYIIPEWRGVDFDLDETDNNIVKKHSFIGTLTRLREQESSNTQADPLLEALEWSRFHNLLDTHGEDWKPNFPKESDWLDKLKKHGHAYMLFCNHWMDYLLHHFCMKAPGQITWQVIKGYNKILKSFLLEMKWRPIVEYPEALISFGRTLLAIPKRFNVFMKILMRKTNLNDIRTVSACCELMGDWLLSMRSFHEREVFWKLRLKSFSSKIDPSNFDHHFFLLGLDRLMDSKHHQVQLKFLEFLYNHWPSFTETIKKHCMSRLVDERKKFLELFLHWSPEVRKFFIHLLVWRLYPCMQPDQVSSLMIEIRDGASKYARTLIRYGNEPGIKRTLSLSPSQLQLSIKRTHEPSGFLRHRARSVVSEDDEEDSDNNGVSPNEVKIECNSEGESSLTARTERIRQELAALPTLGAFVYAKDALEEVDAVIKSRHAIITPLKRNFRKPGYQPNKENGLSRSSSNSSTGRGSFFQPPSPKAQSNPNSTNNNSTTTPNNDKFKADNNTNEKDDNKECNQPDELQLMIEREMPDIYWSTVVIDSTGDVISTDLGSHNIDW